MRSFLGLPVTGALRQQLLAVPQQRQGLLVDAPKTREGHDTGTSII